MRIGIVIPAFNVAPYIGDAIRSVLAQTWPDWTMVIVDDGSTDGTAAVAASFDDLRIHLVRQPNAGVSSARNRGMTMIDADAVLFLDGDDWLSPVALARLAASLHANPRTIASVGPYLRTPGRGRVRHPASGNLFERLLIRNLFANGGHLLIRRAAVDSAGPFDPKLSYGEDWEYWTRLAALGPFAAVEDPAPLLFVRERAGGAYLAMATKRESFTPCMDAIFTAPALLARLGPQLVHRLRERAEAENEWIIGRELIRHGLWTEGRMSLRRSFRAAPSLRRLALLLAGSMPAMRIGPFRPYPASEI
jgi:glycosyltransferase involved in cell wall biosynthesis